MKNTYIPLEEWNQKRKEQAKRNPDCSLSLYIKMSKEKCRYPLPNGLSCPSCGGALGDLSDMIIDIPCRVEVMCIDCGRKDFRIA